MPWHPRSIRHSRDGAAVLRAIVARYDEEGELKSATRLRALECAREGKITDAKLTVSGGRLTNKPWSTNRIENNPIDPVVALLGLRRKKCALGSDADVDAQFALTAGAVSCRRGSRTATYEVL